MRASWCQQHPQAVGVLLVMLMLVGAAATPASAQVRSRNEPVRAQLSVLETTDLHTHVLSYDYLRLADEPSFGLDRTATLIRQARAESANSILIDAGDTIEGTALADFQATVKAPGCGEPIAIFKAMNALGYDAATVGNHEFNYGLNWLSRASGRPLDVTDDGASGKAERCAGTDFPLVLANVIGKKSQQTLFPPFVILKRTVQATTASGQTLSRTLRIGVIGFTPPQIMVWDKRWLDGKVETVGMLAAARHYIPAMRQAGADLVVVVSHGGLDASPYQPSMESGNYHLLKDVPGIDVLLMGHSHQVFPDPASKAPGFNAPGVDKVRGTVHGVPAVMAGFWGRYLGVIKLELAHDGKRWQVQQSATRVEARPIKQLDGQYVAADPVISRIIAAEHEQTKAYVRTPIGSSDFAMSTFFADVGDVTALKTVNMAQADFVEKQIQGDPARYAALQGLPVLSMASPFKSGFAGPGDYTDIAPGPLGINNAADLYVYPNTVHAVKVNGVGLKLWLESAARRFHRIDPAKVDAQELIAGVPGYNFDMLTSPDVRYQIDISQPVGSRIRNLSYRGKLVDDSMVFVVATNNYRASSLANSEIVFSSLETNRDVVVGYVTAAKNLVYKTHGAARSWTFTPLPHAGPVVFHAPPDKISWAQAAAITNVQQIKADDGQGKGMALYELNLKP